MGLLWRGSSAGGLSGAVQAPSAATVASAVGSSRALGDGGYAAHPSILGPGHCSWAAPAPCRGSGTQPMAPGVLLAQGLGRAVPPSASVLGPRTVCPGCGSLAAKLVALTVSCTQGGQQLGARGPPCLVPVVVGRDRAERGLVFCRSCRS